MGNLVKKTNKMTIPSPLCFGCEEYFPYLCLQNVVLRSAAVLTPFISSACGEPHLFLAFW